LYSNKLREESGRMTVLLKPSGWNGVATSQQMEKEGNERDGEEGR